MHEELWAGVELKLDNAKFHFEKMGQSLEPPEPTHTNVALQAAGTIIDTRWQRSFYAHLDALLPATRSVADVINCCFGHDRGGQMKDWFDNLPDNEKDRRCRFSRRFQKNCNSFAQLALSKARNISVHRMGYPDVTVAVNGMFGVTYIGSPTNPVPISETAKTADSELAWLHTPQPLYPMWTDFKIDGQGLFEACADYLKKAQDLKNDARGIAQQVHASNALTPPS